MEWCAGVALPSAGAGHHDAGKRAKSKEYAARDNKAPDGGDKGSQDHAAELSDLPRAARKNKKRKMKRESSRVESREGLPQA